MSVPKVKGSNVLSAVKMLRANRERAVALLPATYHHYLDSRIIVSSWYPETDLLELLRAVSFMLPGSPDPWMIMGRISARGDLNELYKNMVRPGDLVQALRSASTLWRTFHDSGEMKLTLESPDRVGVRLRGFAATTREFCRVIGGYTMEVTAVASGREVTAVKTGCTLDGAAECSWQLTLR